MITALTALLPETAIRRLGWSLGYAASYVCRQRLRHVQQNMSRVLGGDAEPRQAAREVFGNYGRYWAELLWMQSHGGRDGIHSVVVEGLAPLLKAKAASRGVILAMPYLGNWDVLGTVALKEEIPLTVVGEFLPERHMRRWFIKLRKKLGIEFLPAGSQGVSTWALAKKLRAGGAVALFCDRDLSGTGVPVKFFGEETTLPAAPATLAELTGAPIFPAAVYFQPGRGHRVVIHPPLEPATAGSMEQRLRMRTQRLAQALEALVREAPTQWHLLRPNWPADR